ncbi:hypothetical protein AUK40_00405 [Candidatus Wirthbacteria bacterium CG2_30_54_11]|uniref:Cytochrome C biogenesis protein transmembrane domain-containing protein n=1 Tax=Candidatus Wirthbacteria bacterium CG2_30_54_11 TaxID=1817892 RepID=A0A1J5IRL7_9BACT|nr:MAG: hypothetical protein AUK40_00405 [Candidatus Wirthbacteria bacterium CG2_30_54_11]
MDSQINLVSSFVAGVASFINPCVIALFPLYISAVFGRQKSITRAAAFGAGFLLWFVLLGSSAAVLSCAFTKNAYSDLRDILIIVMGIMFVFQPLLGPLFELFESRLQRYLSPVQKAFQRLAPKADVGSSASLFAAFILGIIASLAWTPCVGPILGAILTLSVEKGAGVTPIIMLTVYGLGLLIPFLALAFVWDKVKTQVARMRYFFLVAYPVIGIALICYGLWSLAGS